MPSQVVTAKRKLEITAVKSRIQSDDEESVKKARYSNFESPSSSPIKGPLRDDSDENIHSFVAKCFYGLKKSQPRKKNVSLKENRNNTDSSVSSGELQPTKHFKLGNGKIVYPRTQTDVLMLERATLSPVKQAVLESCSLTQFRKIYHDEYMKLEQDIQHENRQIKCFQTNTKRHENEDNCDASGSSSSDDEVSFNFKVHHSRVSCEDLNEDKLNSDNEHQELENESLDFQIRSPRRSSKDYGCNGNNIASLKAKRAGEDKSKSEKNTEKPTNIVMEVSSKMSTPASKSANIVTPTSSGRKFFKSRSALDTAKGSSVIFSRGFNMKFFPRSPKPFDKKALQNRRLETKQNRLSAKNRTIQQSKSIKSGKQISQPSGFTFASGFLTPEKRSPEVTDALSGSCELDDNSRDFSLNKSKGRTYELSSPGGMGNKSPSDSCSDHFNSSTENAHYCATRKDGRGLISPHDVSDMSRQASNKKIDKPFSSLQKLFPIFSKSVGNVLSLPNSEIPSSPQVTGTQSKQSKMPKDPGNSQMIIDAGQKKFGITQCSVCSMIYSHSDPTDEAAHSKFHHRIVEALKFPGWKKERVVQEYPMDGSRVILVLHDDPKYARKKVEEVNQVMGKELGFADFGLSLDNPFLKVFLYVVDKQILGCCLAEPIKEGFPIKLGVLDNTEESGQRPWRCSDKPEPACIGISRLWVTAENRKSGIATKLVDCVRQWFDYGTLIHKNRIAFSDPTPDGQKFAQKYTGNRSFLVYRYRH